LKILDEILNIVDDIVNIVDDIVNFVDNIVNFVDDIVNFVDNIVNFVVQFSRIYTYWSLPMIMRAFFGVGLQSTGRSLKNPLKIT